MKRNGIPRAIATLFAVLGLITAIGCAQPGDEAGPTVVSTVPADAAVGAPMNGLVRAVFSEAMDPATITDTTFLLLDGATPVAGTVSYDALSLTAAFAPDAELTAETLYTATVTTGVLSFAGEALETAKSWSFTTGLAGAQAAVDLGTAANFVVLAKTAISTVPTSIITGDIGLSPAAESFMTGFSQTQGTGSSTSTQVVGLMKAADMTAPTPAELTLAVSDMEAAYTDAAGRIFPDVLELGTGAIGGEILAPGLYTWAGTVTVASDVTFNGSATDVWILQIGGALTVDAAMSVLLTGGALPENIFWQVAGVVSMGADANFEGIILAKTAVTFGANTSMNGRALAQTNVALNATTITEPTP